MKHSRIEVVPQIEFIECVLEHCINRLLTVMERECGQRLSLNMGVFKDGEEISRLGPTSCTDTDGELKLRFRPTFHDDNYQFFVDSVFECVTTVRGFTAKGHVKKVDGSLVLKLKGWSVKHNEKKWLLWR